MNAMLMNLCRRVGKIACAAVTLVVLIGCESTPKEENRGDLERLRPLVPGGSTPKVREQENREEGPQPIDKPAVAAPDWVDEEAKRYTILFDGGDYSALEPARERLVSAGDPGIRFMVQFLLGRSLARPSGEFTGDGQDVADRIATIRRHAEVELVAIGEPGHEYLEEVTLAGKSDLSRQAARIIAFGGEAGVDRLGRALARGNDRSRKLIVEALGGSGSRRALSHVTRVLDRDPDWQVRGVAAAALGPLGRDVDAATAVAALTRASQAEKDTFVFEQIAAAIVEINDPAGMDAAVNCLERFVGTDPPQLVHARAIGTWMVRTSGQNHGLDPAAWRSGLGQ